MVVSALKADKPFLCFLVFLRLREKLRIGCPGKRGEGERRLIGAQPRRGGGEQRVGSQH